MPDDQALNATEERAEARRRFFKTAGQVAVTTPAVTMPLSAGSKSSVAGLKYVCKGQFPFQDQETPNAGAGECDGSGNDGGDGQSLIEVDGRGQDPQGV